MYHQLHTDTNLQPRQYFGGYNRCYGGRCNSTWNRWGRWVLLACIIVFGFALFFLFSCLSAKRRRKTGANPYYGTGWTVRHGPVNYANTQPTAQPYYANNAQSTPYYNNSNNPPPAYNTAGANNTYYGGNGIELQQPQAAYNGTYAPPKDPPPGRQ